MYTMNDNENIFQAYLYCSQGDSAIGLQDTHTSQIIRPMYGENP